MTPTSSPATQRVVRSDADAGVDLAVHIAGSVGAGAHATVLLIHGGIHDHMHATRFWTTTGVTPALGAAGYRVLAPDRRNTPGDTRTTFATHTWQAEADDLLAILDALLPADTRVHVIAASNGCAAAVQLALLAPQRVASLLLGWPAAPDLEPLHSDFERTAAAVARARDTASHLAALQRDGVPRPAGARPGYPFGTALVHDPQLAATFTATSPADAAAIIRASAAALFPGNPLRGMAPADAVALRTSGIMLGILPSIPADHWHPPHTVDALRAILPTATLLPISPPPPHPGFADHQHDCVASLLTWLHQQTP